VSTPLRCVLKNFTPFFAMTCLIRSRFRKYLAEMLPKGISHTYCNYVNTVLSVVWFDFQIASFCFSLTFSVASVSENLMIILEAVVCVHRTVVTSNNMRFLLWLFVCIILSNIIKICLESKSYGAHQKGVKFSQTRCIYATYVDINAITRENTFGASPSK